MRTQSLANHAAVIEEHPGGQDAQMRFLARSLATDSRNLRRFDDALDTLEDLLASQGDPAMLLGPLTDYLVVSICVKESFRLTVFRTCAD